MKIALFGQLLGGRPGDAEVDHLRLRLVAVVHGTVAGLEVPVDDPLLVGVLHGVAHLREELETLRGVELLAVAVGAERFALDFHDEEGRPCSVAWPRTPARCRWFIIASACRSASKRATTISVSMPALMTLSATRRLTGSVCSARYTTPKPPSPMMARILNAPIVSPGTIRWVTPPPAPEESASVGAGSPISESIVSSDSSAMAREYHAAKPDRTAPTERGPPPVGEREDGPEEPSDESLSGFSSSSPGAWRDRLVDDAVHVQVGARFRGAPGRKQGREIGAVHDAVAVDVAFAAEQEQEAMK